MMNTYYKYGSSLFIAKCPEPHEKGEIIELTSKYGKSSEVEVYNLVKEQDGFYFYSFVRCDGINRQTKAQKKADKYARSAIRASVRSKVHFDSATTSNRGFLSLGEPIKYDHSSASRHQRVIDRNHRQMEKAIDEQEKAEWLEHKSAYWEKRASEIDVSMPESLDYYRFEYEKQSKMAADYKANSELANGNIQYLFAKKNAAKFKRKLALAELLWG